jgi:hypothetical protein
VFAIIEHMFETTSSPPPHDLLASIAATLSDLSVRVERLDTRIETVVTARPQPEPAGSASDEWVWEGNRGWPRALGRPADW